jgi:hypothetical protein
MSVTGLSEYKKAMNDAKAAVKTLDAELKLNEAQYKANGDAEQYMTNKSALLKNQIDQQTKVVQNAEAALKQMEQQGTRSGTGYEKMRQQVYNSTQKLVEMRTELQQVESGAKAADTELGKIGKGVSWENVTSGIKDITKQLESGARAAINFGKRIARSAMDSTGWADDILTRASQYGVDTETLQKMDRVAEYIDTDVDAIITARDRMSRNRESLSDLLGITADGRDVNDVFWEAGEAIMNLGDGFDKSEYAQKIFGRSWRELLPLFTAGREEYESMMESQNVLTDEQVRKLGEADDAFKSVQQQAEMIKNQFWADNADKITKLLQWLIDNQDAVVGAVTAIGGAFALIKIGEFALNLGKVVEGFKTLGLLGGTGTTGAPVVTATPTGGTGGLFGSLLNKLTLFGAAGAVYEATEGQIKKNMAEFDAATAGMTDAEKNKAAVMQTFGWTEADWYQYHYGDKQDQNGRFFGTGETPEITVAPVVEEGAASDITEQVGTVDINGIVHITGVDGANLGVSGNWWGGDGSAVRPHRVAGHANGLPWVPYDGYLSVLHRGERVLTASENRNYTYNSNTYFGSVNLNNGLEIDALTDSIARQNRRQRSGYGT